MSRLSFPLAPYERSYSAQYHDYPNTACLSVSLLIHYHEFGPHSRPGRRVVVFFLVYVVEATLIRLS